MTTELTKAAQQALEALEEIHNGRRHPRLALAVAHNLRRALTQRPAAQEVEHSDQLTKAKRLLVDLHKIGGAEVRSMIEARTGSWFVWGQDRSLPAPQQATPARPDFDAWWSSDGPNTASPYDAARSAWEAARQQATPEPERITVQEAWEAAGGNPGIKATKADLLEALRQLDKVCDEATPEPNIDVRTILLDIVPGDGSGQEVFAKSVDDVVVKLTELAEREESLRTQVDLLTAAVEARGREIAKLKAAPEPVGEPFGWVCRYLCHADDDGEQRWTDWYFTLSSESVPPKWSRGSYAAQEAVPVFTRPAAAPAVPEDSALLDYLDTLATRPAGSDLHCFGGRVVLYVRTGIGSQIEASGAGTAREAIRAAMLAAAQAKGGV